METLDALLNPDPEDLAEFHKLIGRGANNLISNILTQQECMNGRCNNSQSNRAEN